VDPQAPIAPAPVDERALQQPVSPGYDPEAAQRFATAARTFGRLVNPFTTRATIVELTLANAVPGAPADSTGFRYYANAPASQLRDDAIEYVKSKIFKWFPCSNCVPSP